MWNHKHPITHGSLLQEQGCPCTPNGTGLPSALHPEGRTAWPLPKQVVLPEQPAWDMLLPSHGNIDGCVRTARDLWDEAQHPHSL